MRIQHMANVWYMVVGSVIRFVCQGGFLTPMVMTEAGWGGVRLKHPEAAVESAQVRGIGGMSYSSGTSGEKNEEMSKKGSFIKIWTQC